MKTINKFLIGSLTAIVTIITFSMSINYNSLNSLRVKAKETPTGTKCCPQYGVDCISPSTGNIYPNMRDC